MAINTKVFAKAVVLLMENPNLLMQISKTELSFPNIPLKVYDGKIFWETLIEYNGWELQQNTFSHHARILNNEKKRIAWGTLHGMEKALDEMIRISKKYNKEI